MKNLRVLSLIIAVLVIFTLASCKGEDKASGSYAADTSAQSESEEETLPAIKIGAGKIENGVANSETYGKVVELLSLTPLTDAPSFIVKNTVNYKWIAYNNYNLVMHYESGTKLAEGGYLFYTELPETDFSHEMYFEFFASVGKVAEYSGEVAYTESDKLWYSLPLGASGWQEHTSVKYKLCFDDNGAAFKGYVFIPASSLTYRYESSDLSTVCAFVKSGIETGNGDVGNGIDFKMSAVLPVDTFDKTALIAESGNGRVDLSKNEIIE